MTDPLDAPVYVHTLDVRGFKRLNAVHIDAGGAAKTVLISGKNTEGKSSALDSLASLFDWKTISRKTPNPVNVDADSAQVIAALSNGLTITRTWTKDGKSKLTVTGPDGKARKSPQALLDDLTGALTFDPLAFTRASEAEQYRLLTEAVDARNQLTEVDRMRSEAYAARTDAGRRLKDAQAVAAAAPAVPVGTPDEEVSAADLLRRIQDGQANNAAVRAADDRVTAARDAVAAAEAVLEQRRAELRAAQADALDAPTDLVDVDALTAQLGALEDTNRAVRAKRAHAEHEAAAHRAHVEWERLNLQIGNLDETKRTLIQEAQLPIRGLSFDEENRITYLRQPLSQCSTAQRIEVSVAIAMALNSRLRVIRVEDAATLDTESREALTRMAEDNGYQLWVELASDGQDIPGALVIEDGRVRADALD